MSTDANAPPPAGRGRPHLPHIEGLDGIRAVAVLGIIAFHTGISWVPGGFYGVDAFFVLSGYLITTLLVSEWAASGTIRLRRFWAGRARRLLPALFVLVAVIGGVLLALPNLLATPHVLGDALSTVFYASNWYSIHGGVSYFSTVSTQPSPLLHTWSLAIEEQFYLVWPLVVLTVLTVGTGARMQRRRARRLRRQQTVRVLEGGFVTLIPFGSTAPEPAWTRRRRLHLLFALASFGALASAIEMVLLAPNGYTDRAYYGTDTRAQALLVGASIAAGLALWEPGRLRWFRWGAAVAGLLGVVGSGVLWALANQSSVFAFSGGFLVASIAAGAVVLCSAIHVRAPTDSTGGTGGRTRQRRPPSIWLLELPPLPWLGTISYGIYLWYWPVLLVMSPTRIHWSVYPLFAARVAVTVAIATASAYLVELPIRRGALARWRSWVAAPVGAAVAVGAVMLSTLVPVGATTASAPLSTTTTTRPVSTTTPTTAFVPVPSAMQPEMPSVKPTHRVKVLLLGDSIAGSLGVGLSEYESNNNVQIANEGTPGCSLSMTQEIRVLFYTLPPGSPCNPNNPNALLNQWKTWIDQYNPDVVLYLARGETFDQEHNGAWVSIEDASFAHYVESRYRAAVQVLGSKGATVVLMTTPYYSSGVQVTGAPWPEDAPIRAVIDNQIIKRVATTMTSGPSHNRVYVFNLNEVVSPGNHFVTDLGPVDLRCGDGVHFSRPGGVFVGLQLLPDLALLGQAHAAASPGGAWHGPLPASTPTWYQKLPCQ
jgi:peptidoglycan/LPS O-acetylase OafA/YrhL